jgi:hypothetical protein
MSHGTMKHVSVILFYGLALTLFVLTPCRFLLFRIYNFHRDLMSNFFNNRSTMLKLIVRVRTYYIHLDKIVDLKTGFLRFCF